MFTKKPDPAPINDAARMASLNAMRAQPVTHFTTPPNGAAPVSGRAASGTPSVIGPDLLITGNLHSKGEIQIEGEVQGDVDAAHIVIGERAKITGGLLAEDVVVRGHVMGSVRGTRVSLQASSRVEGDIFHKSLAIEQGGHGDPDHRHHQLALVDRAHQNQPRHRRHHRAAHAFDHAREHELGQRLRCRRPGYRRCSRTRSFRPDSNVRAPNRAARRHRFPNPP